MASLKVFISSTCYDLGVVRSKLQEFIRSLGYEPVLSEYSDVLFHPGTHTHTSCIDEVANCDIVLLLIGARFGGKAVPEALSRIDFTKIKPGSDSTWCFEEGRSLSITQLEVFKAIELQQPVFVFVDERVMHDHLVYEKNKQKSILSEITFPSIDKPESAQYIFEFINFLRLRSTGNAVTTFARIDDIEVHLRKQWSGLVQRLLREDRTRSADAERARQIQQQLDDLKTAILSTIQVPEAREVARGVIRFRTFIEFASALPLPDKRQTILDETLTWSALMSAASVDKIAHVSNEEGGLAYSTRVLFRFRNGACMVTRLPWTALIELSDEVQNFGRLAQKVREAIWDAWTDTNFRRDILRPIGRSFDDYVAEFGQSKTIELYDVNNLARPLNVQKYENSNAELKGTDEQAAR